MLYLFTGTDRARAREAMQAMVRKEAKGARLVHVTDSHTLDDLRAAFMGPGLFDEKRAIELDGVLANEEMRTLVLDSLEMLRDSDEYFFMLEEKPDAATRKKLEKYAQKSEKFDAAKQAEDTAIFGLKQALVRGDKKALWVGIERELIAGKSPEAVHGFLFWAAKDMCLRGSDTRARTLVAELAALPHEARRRGEELGYALERFVLSRV